MHPLLVTFMLSGPELLCRQHVEAGDERHRGQIFVSGRLRRPRDAGLGVPGLPLFSQGTFRKVPSEYLFMCILLEIKLSTDKTTV